LKPCEQIGLNKSASWVALVLCQVLLLASSNAGESRFFDPETGQVHLSEHLLQRSGVLPTPIVITKMTSGVVGYRHLDLDFEDGRLDMDANMTGPFLAVDFIR